MWCYPPSAQTFHRGSFLHASLRGLLLTCTHCPEGDTSRPSMGENCSSSGSQASVRPPDNRWSKLPKCHVERERALDVGSGCTTQFIEGEGFHYRQRFHSALQPGSCCDTPDDPQPWRGREEPVSSSLLSTLLLDHICSVSTSLSRLICPISLIRGQVPPCTCPKTSTVDSGNIHNQPLAHV